MLENECDISLYQLRSNYKFHYYIFALNNSHVLSYFKCIDNFSTVCNEFSYNCSIL